MAALAERVVRKVRGRIDAVAGGIRSRLDLRALRRDAVRLRPSAPRAVVVVTGLTPRGFSGRGKVVAAEFFPPFCATLAASGLETRFATSIGELRPAVAADVPTVIVNVYSEVAFRIDTPEMIEIEGRAAGVFNRSQIGPVVADKVASNRFLTEHGVAMPGMVPEGRVFSNSRQATKAPVVVLDSLAEADDSRYNTAFVDTRVSHGGRSYYTCVRLLCVGSRIVHAYVRARPVEEGSPSVHAADTPLDAELVNFLQRRLVDDRLDEMAELAAKVAAALGPGFYAHDVLVDVEGGALLLCETGFKFNDGAYERRLSPLAAQIPVHRILYASGALPEASAARFIAECERLAFF